MTHEGEYTRANLENTVEQTDKLKKIDKKISLAGQGHFHCFFLNFHTWQLLPFSLFVSQRVNRDEPSASPGSPQSQG